MLGQMTASDSKLQNTVPLHLHFVCFAALKRGCGVLCIHNSCILSPSTTCCCCSIAAVLKDLLSSNNVEFQWPNSQQKSTARQLRTPQSRDEAKVNSLQEREQIVACPAGGIKEWY